MKKFIKFIIYGSAFSVFLLLILTVFVDILPNPIRITLIMLDCLYIIISMFSSIFLTQEGYDASWFKSVEDLKEEIIKNIESWKKAEKLIKILGQHEAIKLWNEENEKKKVNET